MTQDERWSLHYKEILKYMDENKRRPSKHRKEDRKMHNWIKYNKKILNRNELTGERLEQFNHLLEVAEKYRRLNQYAYLEED